MSYTRRNHHGHAKQLGIYAAGLLIIMLAMPAKVFGQSGTDNVTFAADIAPILQRSCQNCHRANSIAPMSLMTYEEVRPYARRIKERTMLRDRMGVMPPWFIEKDVGIQAYKNDISLNDTCLLYTSPSPRDVEESRMPSSA